MTLTSPSPLHLRIEYNREQYAHTKHWLYIADTVPVALVVESGFVDVAWSTRRLVDGRGENQSIDGDQTASTLQICWS